MDKEKFGITRYRDSPVETLCHLDMLYNGFIIHIDQVPINYQ